MLLSFSIIFFSENITICYEIKNWNSKIKLLEGIFHIIVILINFIGLFHTIFICDRRVKIYNEIAILIANRKMFGVLEIFGQRKMKSSFRRTQILISLAIVLAIVQSSQASYIIFQRRTNIPCKIYQLFVSCSVFLSQMMGIFEFVIEADVFKTIFQALYENIKNCLEHGITSNNINSKQGEHLQKSKYKQ